MITWREVLQAANGDAVAIVKIKRHLDEISARHISTLEPPPENTLARLVWHEKAHRMPWWRKVIVRAAPSCTLWVYDPYWCGWYFRFNRRWKISELESMMVVAI